MSNDVNAAPPYRFCAVTAAAADALMAVAFFRHNDRDDRSILRVGRLFCGCAVRLGLAWARHLR